MKRPPKPRYITRQSLTRKDLRTWNNGKPSHARRSGYMRAELDMVQEEPGSILRIYPDHETAQLLFTTDTHAHIRERLQQVGVRFEHWSTDTELTPGASEEDVIAAYARDIDRLVQEEGYQSIDVVSLNTDNPKKAELRQVFLQEHRHSEDEVRFFVAGEGLFSLHIDNKVYEVLCLQGDLISVPANTPHWFDMGDNPGFIAIRLFNNPDGWVANYTGSPIADRFNRLEN
jgi:1,2-dihydroxy-3-keto-5-methylthiopentene dioxygenase